MNRPHGVTLIAVYLTVFAVLALVFTPIQASRQATFMLFGAPVGARTYLIWTLLQSSLLLYLAWAFWKGMRLGFYVYAALKPAQLLVWLGQGVLGSMLPWVVIEGGLLAYVAHHRAWFRN